jgi:hypothetical protein
MMEQSELESLSDLATVLSIRTERTTAGGSKCGHGIRYADRAQLNAKRPKWKHQLSQAKTMPKANITLAKV